MNEDFIIYRLAKVLGLLIAFLFRHQSVIVGTTAFMFVFALSYVLFSKHIGQTFALMSALGSSLLVSAFVLIRFHSRRDDK